MVCEIGGEAKCYEEAGSCIWCDDGLVLEGGGNNLGMEGCVTVG